MALADSELLLVTTNGRPTEVLPALSSLGLGWEGIGVNEYVLRDAELPARAIPEHQVTLQLSAPQRVLLRPEGRTERRWMLPGQSCVSPSGYAAGADWRGERQLMFIRLSSELVDQTADEMGVRGRYTIAPNQAMDDPHLEHLGRALRAELQAGNPSGRLFPESLARAFAVRLLSIDVVSSSAPETPALSPSTLRRVEAFVEEHLSNDVSLSALAASARMSPFHFARGFKKATGSTPHRYVLARRLEHAKQLLESTDLPIAEVAARVGCADQSHLTALFRRLMATTPAVYRRGSRD